MSELHVTSNPADAEPQVVRPKRTYTVVVVDDAGPRLELLLDDRNFAEALEVLHRVLVGEMLMSDIDETLRRTLASDPAIRESASKKAIVLDHRQDPRYLLVDELPEQVTVEDLSSERYGKAYPFPHPDGAIVYHRSSFGQPWLSRSKPTTENCVQMLRAGD